LILVFIENSQIWDDILRNALPVPTYLPLPSLRHSAPLALGIVLAVLLASFVALREDRWFWLDGTSPARLRGLVASMFWPLVWFQSAWLIRLTWNALPISSRPPRPFRTLPVLVAVLWYVHGATLLAAVHNNLDNVFSGRPLHWHPEDHLLCAQP